MFAANQVSAGYLRASCLVLQTCFAWRSQIYHHRILRIHPSHAYACAPDLRSVGQKVEMNQPADFDWQTVRLSQRDSAPSPVAMVGLGVQ